MGSDLEEDTLRAALDITLMSFEETEDESAGVDKRLIVNNLNTEVKVYV